MPEKKLNELHVLFISAEADPYVKIGGLGDVAGSLPSALLDYYNIQKKGCKLDIRVAIPYYGIVQRQNLPVKKSTSFSINSTKGPVEVEVFETTHKGLTIYFISGQPIHPEDPVYGEKFVADAEKFVFFSLACLELPKIINWNVDIIHAQDWHTAITVHQLKEEKQKDTFYKNTSSVITVHNLPFMGSGSEEALEEYYVKPSSDSTLPIWGMYQPLPMGLSAADQIIAVSPTYAQEILTPEFSCDLHTFLKTKKNKLSGIVNGLDIRTWDPSSDQYISATYTRNSLNNKEVDKVELQKEFGLEIDKDIPLLIMIGRMDSQKGVDLAIDGMRMMKHVPWQLIILGSGDKQLEQRCQSLEDEFTNRVRSVLAFNSPLSHRMYAGGDMILMPSRYEPCGLAQMISMRYGCIPIARSTGGLRDTIVDQNQYPDKGTGFLFDEVSAQALTFAVAEAITWYHDSLEWKKIIDRAMQMDFSWNKSAREYSKIYETISHYC